MLHVTRCMMQVRLVKEKILRFLTPNFFIDVKQFRLGFGMTTYCCIFNYLKELYILYKNEHAKPKLKLVTIFTNSSRPFKILF